MERKKFVDGECVFKGRYSSVWYDNNFVTFTPGESGMRITRKDAYYNFSAYVDCYCDRTNLWHGFTFIQKIRIRILIFRIFNKLHREADRWDDKKYQDRIRKELKEKKGGDYDKKICSLCSSMPGSR